MNNTVLFGRPEFTENYNRIILELNTLLSTEELQSFEIETNLIWDSLGYGIEGDDEIVPITDFTDDNLYAIFKSNIEKVLDNILLTFGIKSELKYMPYYLAVFTMLNNVKNNTMDRESYSLIISGDYGIEDKLYMLLEDFSNETVNIIDDIDVSELFLEKLESYLTVTTIDTNIDMLTRALEFSASDSKFKDTSLFLQIMNSKETTMLNLSLGLPIINGLIRENSEKYFKEEVCTNNTGLILEIAYTYLYYNTDTTFKLNTLVNKESIFKTFNVDIDNNTINNTLATITIGNK